MDKVASILEKLKTYKPQKVIVFGSYVRGEADEYSDLDFVVIKDTEKRFLERLIEVAKVVGTEFGRVDIFVYTPEEFKMMKESGNPFIENVVKEGREIYEIE